MVSNREAAFLVEVLQDGCVDGGERLKTSHAPEAEHRPLPASKWQARILGAIIEPSTSLLSIARSDFLQSGTIGPELVRHDGFGLSVFAHGFIEEFERRAPIAGLRHEAL